MCTYLKFLRASSKKTDRPSLSELKGSLEKDHTSFILGLKTLSYLLSVKSGEVHYGNHGSERICRYFNDPLPDHLEEFLEGLEEECVEPLVVEVTNLLEENACLGLTPIVNKLGPGYSTKEFYQRTLALLINLSLESKKKYGKSGEECTPVTKKFKSYEACEKWRMEELKSNATFNLCRLSVALSIFGTEEVGLFTSFSDIPGSLLGLFSKELWVYLLGAIPTLCFDPKYLFSLNAIRAYTRVVSDQYYALLQNLIRWSYFDTGIGSKGNLMMLCNWIDFIYKNAVNGRELWTEGEIKNEVECSWASKLLDNKVIWDVMYEVMKLEPNLCMETLVKLTEVNENILFIQNIVYGPEIKVELVLELLGKLDLQIVAKDATSVRNVLTYMVEGTKGKRKISFVKLWKKYLNQYRKVKVNRQAFVEGFRKLLREIMEEWYEEMEYRPECFNAESVNKEVNKNKMEEDSVDEVLLCRNVFKSLVKVVGCKEYEKKIIKSIEKGCEAIKKDDLSKEGVEKVEFGMFLAWVLDLKEKYREFEEVKVNNARVMFNLHLMKLKEGEVDLEEENRVFVKFYNIESMIKGKNKGYVGQLSRLMVGNGGSENKELSKKNIKTKEQMFKTLVKKYTKNIMGNIMSKFPELTRETLGKCKTYMNYTTLYLKVYKEVKEGENIKELEEESKEWIKYKNIMEKVIVNGMAIMIKYEHLAVQYKEIIKMLIQMRLYEYVKALECRSKASEVVAGQILENMEEGRSNSNNNNMEMTSKFVIEMEEKLRSKESWTEGELELFEKVLKIVTKLMEKVENINELITEKKGQCALKNIIVIANGLTIKEQKIRKQTNKLNIELLKVLLEINKISNNNNNNNSNSNNNNNNNNNNNSNGFSSKLRKYEYAKKKLEEIVTSGCGRFEIVSEVDEEKLALGTLSVMDLMIYQSFGQLFGDQRGTRKEEKGSDKSKVIDKKEIKSNQENLSEKKINYKRNLDGSKKDWKNQKQTLNRLKSVSLIGVEGLLSLEFIGKMYSGFSSLPKNKLMLISEFFFHFASVKTGKKTQEIKKRFLTEDNQIRSEATELIYEVNKAVEANSIF